MSHFVIGIYGDIHAGKLLWDSTTSMRKLFQCSVTLTVNKIFLVILFVPVPSCSISGHHQKSLDPFSKPSLQILTHIYQIPREPSLLWNRWTGPAPLAFPHNKRGFSPFAPFSSPFLSLLRTLTPFFFLSHLSGPLYTLGPWKG